MLQYFAIYCDRDKKIRVISDPCVIRLGLKPYAVSPLIARELEKSKLKTVPKVVPVFDPPVKMRSLMCWNVLQS